MSIGRNTSIGMVADGAIFGLSILVSVVLTRSLGPDQRGVYALLVATNVLLANIGYLGVSYGISPMLARGKYSLGEINTISMLLALLLGVICLLGTTLAFPFLSNNLFANIPYYYLAIPLVLTSATIYQIYWNSIMVGIGRVPLLYKLNLATNIANALLMVTAVGLLKLGIPGFLAAWSLSALISAAAMLIIAARIEPLAWRVNRAALQELLGFGLRVHGTSVAHQIFLRFDVYLINPLLGTRAVGFYSLSTSLAEKLWLPLNAMYASSTGKIAQLPPDESALLTAKLSRTALLMMLTIALPFALVSPVLIPALYGPEFSASVLPLIILLAGTVGFAVMQVLNLYIIGQMQRPGLLSIISWLQLAVSIPLYIVMILWQGIIGAALASAATYVIAMLSTLFVFARHSGLPLHQALVPRPDDFRDYARIFRAGLHRVQFVIRNS